VIDDPPQSSRSGEIDDKEVRRLARQNAGAQGCSFTKLAGDGGRTPTSESLLSDARSLARMRSCKWGKAVVESCCC
jgi:hypothetical protein